MQGTVVAVLRGGPSREHDVSLGTGARALTELPHGTYTLRDIYIDRSGVWHERGIPTTPERVLPSLDAALIALHGTYGHSGDIQKLLARYGVPYSGSDPFSSYIAMHKVFAREKAKEQGLLSPRYVFVAQGTEPRSAASEINRSFMPPVLVGPAFGSSLEGISAHGYAPIEEALRLLHASGQDALVSEQIRGDDVFVGVIENFRDEALYTLPPTGAKKETRVVKSIAEALSEAARNMHQALGLRQYSHSRFIISPKGIYYLSTSALPPLTHDAPMARALEAVGIRLSDFFAHILDRARGRI